MPVNYVLPANRDIDLIRVVIDKSTCVTHDCCSQTGLDQRTQRMDIEACGAHNVIAQHFHTVVPDPEFSFITLLMHILDDPGHVQVIICLLAGGAFYSSDDSVEDGTVPIVGCLCGNNCYIEKDK